MQHLYPFLEVAFRMAKPKTGGAVILSSNVVSAIFFRPQSFRLFFISLLFFASSATILFMCPQNVYSVDIVLAWDANAEKDLDGYKIFRKGKGETYNYDNPVLEVQLNELGENPQDPTCTIHSLDDNITHYFVVRSFDTNGFESIDSNEVHYPNVPPTASDQSIITYEDISAHITLRATDVDGDTLIYTIVAYPSHGTLSDTAPNLNYTPNTNYVGSDSFTFKANDGSVDSNTATVTIIVNPVDIYGNGILDHDALNTYSTDPNIADKDSDDDGYFDDFEIKQGSDPLDPDSVPAYSSWMDYRFTLRIRSHDDDAIGVMFRYQDNDNYYRFSWDRQVSYRRLVKQENGEFVVLAEDTARYVPGERYELEVVADGSVLEIRIDGSLIFIVEDGSFSAGSVALYSWCNRGSYFQDVHVEDLATGAVLLSEDFNNGEFSNWNVVDEGNRNGPSVWSARSGMLVQRSNIQSAVTDSAGLAKFGTFALYVLSDDPEPVTSWTD